MPNEGALPVDNVTDLLLNALRDGGVLGEDEFAEQTMLTRAFRQANWKLAVWARHRYLIYRLNNVGKVSTGAQTYSVGLNGDFNINPRPDRLESAFLRLLNNNTGLSPDLPLDIIPAREDYDRIVLKSMGTLPWRVFYDPVWPVGVLYFWPIPQATIYEPHITVKEVLPRFATMQDKINFPPEYEAALNWGLARAFRAMYQMPEDPTVTALAREYLNAIRLANVAVPTLSMPDALRNRGRAYDYHSDS